MINCRDKDDALGWVVKWRNSKDSEVAVAMSWYHKQLTKTSRSKRHPVSGFINSCAVAHQFTIIIKGLSQTAFSYISVYRHNVLAAEYANSIIKVILKGFDHKTTKEHIPYGRKFWRGIYFGGLAVLRAIRQYFIRQIAARCDVIIIAKSYQWLCIY